MSIAIVGKLLGGFIVSSSGVAAIAYMVMNSTPYISLSDTESKNIYIYAISKEITDVPNTIQSTEDIKTGNDEKNYQCKFDDKDYECIISQPKDVDTNKKQANIDDLKADKDTTTITKETLKVKDKIYRIKINFQIGDWTKIQKTEQFSIDIIPKKLNKEADKNKKYASLKPLFAINSDGVTINKYTKTKYFVVKSTSVGTSDSTTTYKCLTDKEPDTVCNVYDFSESSETQTNWHEISFKKPTKGTNSSITANKYYLVELTAEEKIEVVTNIKIQKHVNNAAADVVLEDSSPIPAIRATEDGDNIFILKKADVTSQPASEGGGDS